MTTKIVLGSFALLALLMLSPPSVLAAPVNAPSIPVDGLMFWTPNSILQSSPTTATLGDIADGCISLGIGSYYGTLTITQPNGSTINEPVTPTPCGTYLHYAYSSTSQTGTYTATFKGSDGYNSWTLTDDFSVSPANCPPPGTSTVTVTQTQFITLPAQTITVTNSNTEIVTSIQGPQNASYELLVYYPGTVYSPFNANQNVTVSTSYPPSTQTISYFDFAGQIGFIVYGQGAPDQHSVTLSWGPHSYTIALPTSPTSPMGMTGFTESGFSGYYLATYP